MTYYMLVQVPDLMIFRLQSHAIKIAPGLHGILFPVDLGL